MTDRFRANHLYRHVSSLDIDILPVMVIEEGDHFHLLVKYWNRHLKFFQPDITKGEFVDIKKSDMDKWQLVQN